MQSRTPRKRTPNHVGRMRLSCEAPLSDRLRDGRIHALPVRGFEILVAGLS